MDAPPPELGATIDQRFVEKIGTQVGPYKLREQIGEGGFGVVYVAEQIKPVQRKVALKVIKPGMDSKEVIARFAVERQALALMDHPNVARVLDAGTSDSGLPYFVMELVQGVPITEFCNQQRLSTKERLRLFADVCQAVQHAHQKGVIHRDIKPSNVMVTMYDHRPVVKVIDFGVAKAIGFRLTENTVYTGYGQMVGTPMYMSPEQAQMSGLDVDTRSDVYSLGVLAYELLTGAPPFDKETLQKAGFDEMRRMILEDEPQRPSLRVSTLRAEQLSTISDQRQVDATRLRQSLQGELDWIVMKSLEKDRSRRYESAASLANDVNRYLDNEAVEACPPTVAYRLSKFARRNKAAITVAATMGVLLLAGIATTTWQAVRATFEKNRAVKAERISEQRLKDSEAALKEAEAISSFLTDLLNSPRPKTEGGGRNVSLADLLDEAARRLSDAKGISPDRIVGLQDDLARTYFILGLYDNATELREKVFRHHLGSRGPDHPATLKAKMNLAVAYRETGRLRAAFKMLHQVLESARKVNDSRWILTVQATRHLATSYARFDRDQEAFELREQALQVSRQKLGPEHQETYFAISNLSQSCVSTDRLSEAIMLQEEAAKLGDRIFASDHPERLRAKKKLANVYDLAGRFKEARQIRLEILDQLVFLSKTETVVAEKMLADFELPESGKRWKVANDNAMGGQSEGGPKFRDGKLLFTGKTITQGGGFCSTRIRETDPLDLSFADTVRLRVKGDGRTYLFEMRTKASAKSWPPTPYRAEFATQADKWIEVDIPLENIMPTSLHGESIRDVPAAIDKTDVRSFGLMIYDGNDGEFRLEVDWIKAVSTGTQTKPLKHSDKKKPVKEIALKTQQNVYVFGPLASITMNRLFLTTFIIACIFSTPLLAQGLPQPLARFQFDGNAKDNMGNQDNQLLIKGSPEFRENALYHGGAAYGKVEKPWARFASVMVWDRVMGFESAKTALIPCLSDQNEIVRLAAARTLFPYPPQVVKPMVEELQKSRSFSTRTIAGSLLKEIRSRHLDSNISELNGQLPHSNLVIE